MSNIEIIEGKIVQVIEQIKILKIKQQVFEEILAELRNDNSDNLMKTMQNTPIVKNPSRKGKNIDPDSIASKAIEILKSSDKPLHANEIRNRLEHMGFMKSFRAASTLSHYAKQGLRNVIRTAPNTYTVRV